MLTKTSPLLALTFTTHPRNTVWAGADGRVAVNDPAVWDRYTGSPDVNAEVSIPRTTPNVVTNPSAPLAMDSVVIPRVAADKGSVSASAKTMLGLCPCAPEIATTLPLAIVLPEPL
jgi:hypothetical protein